MSTDTETFYVTAEGVFIGSFIGYAPEGGIAVPTAPADARDIWDFTNSVWIPAPPLPYYLQMSDFWMRLVDDDEYDTVWSLINAGSPRSNRQAFNVAQSIYSEAPLFLWAHALLVAGLGLARTDELMARPVMAMRSEDAQVE